MNIVKKKPSYEMCCVEKCTAFPVMISSCSYSHNIGALFPRGEIHSWYLVIKSRIIWFIMLVLFIYFSLLCEGRGCRFFHYYYYDYYLHLAQLGATNISRHCRIDVCLCAIEFTLVACAKKLDVRYVLYRQVRNEC